MRRELMKPAQRSARFGLALAVSRAGFSRTWALAKQKFPGSAPPLRRPHAALPSYEAELSRGEGDGGGVPTAASKNGVGGFSFSAFSVLSRRRGKREALVLGDACVSARAFALETGRATCEPLGGTPGSQPLYGSRRGAWRLPRL